MCDHNYISTPRSLAAEATPIIINNACSSWHTLAETYTFNNARAYIGTLFQVSTSEAHDVVVKLLGKHFGKPLPVALWSSQREVARELLLFRKETPRWAVLRDLEIPREWTAFLYQSGKP
jgi:hypothetical protein